jgi:nucleoside-diphosphate kinase
MRLPKPRSDRRRGGSVEQPSRFPRVERTLILVKPDAMERGLLGEIVGRFERRGLVVRAAKLLNVDRELAERHYAEHAEKPFFGELVGFITTGSTLALVLEGEDAVRVTRATIGATNPVDAAPGTIRGDLALAMPNNLVHGSDSPETAAREIELWFGDELA